MARSNDDRAGRVYTQTPVRTLEGLRVLLAGLQHMEGNTPVHWMDAGGNSDGLIVSYQEAGEGRFVSFDPQHH